MFWQVSPHIAEGRHRRYGSRFRTVLIATLLLGTLVGALGPGRATAASQVSQVVAWGDNRASQLGLAEGTVERTAPQSIAAATDSEMLAIAAGSTFSLALRSDGTVLSWGSNFPSGQLGQDSAADRLDPASVRGLSGATAIAAGRLYGLAVAGGNVYAWGNNTSNELGTATADICNQGTCSRVAIPIGIANARGVGAGARHSFAVMNDGTLRAWGANSSGQLGDGSTTQRARPVPVAGIGNIVAVTGGEAHTLALAADGTVYAWGQNAHGQLGLGTTDTLVYPTPVQVPGLSGIVAIAAGYRHNVALKGDGTVYTWGFNDSGQIGNGTLGAGTCNCVATPTAVQGIAGATAIGAGDYQSLAVLRDGTGRAWGDNDFAQGGVGAPADLTTPSQIPELTGVRAVAGGGFHAIALRDVSLVTLQVGTAGTGTGTITPGMGTYAAGATVSLTPQAGGDSIFTGWTVDGQMAGHAVPLTITMDKDHAVVATFGKPLAFCDVNQGDPYYAAIRQLSARGVIRGFDPGDGSRCFGPADSTLRAQMAALIARPLGWDQEDHDNPFTDQGNVDGDLWRNVGTLAFYNTARGYAPESCLARGAQAPCYGPTDDVLNAQVIAFIARGMVARGYWQPQPDNPALYPNVPESSGHRQDIATYVYYAGALPGTNGTGEAWGTWSQPSTRDWFAETEWRALDSYFRLDRIP